MPAAGVLTLGGFLRVLEIEARDVASHPDAFERLHSGELHAVLVRGAYAPEMMARAVARLERHDPPFVQTWFPLPFRSWFYGRNLNLTGPHELDAYFDDAERFHAQLEELLPEPHGLTTHLAGLLAQLDGGRPFRAPPGPGPGKRYMFTTLRAHLEGGFIPPHADNEFRLRPSYRHLVGLIEPQLLSFVLAFTRADGGGALEVYDWRLDAEARELMNDDRGRPPDVDGLRSVAFRLEPGALLVLDSGRTLHRLSPVEGPRVRWTACSFMARSRAGGVTYCWG
jgi:hypothetical protein